jgi:hypothetical protein
LGKTEDGYTMNVIGKRRGKISGSEKRDDNKEG